VIGGFKHIVLQLSILYTRSDGKRALRVLTRQLKLGVFYSRPYINEDDSLETLNSEISFICLIRQHLLRFGESNLDYVQKRCTEILGKMIKIYREHDQRVHKIKSFILPDSMRHYPFLLYSFLRSDLMDKSMLRKLTRIEYMRREYMHCSPSRLILEIAPSVYDLSFHITSEHTDKYIMPPRLSVSSYNFTGAGML
jgi:Sec23/Sec24 helical domain